MNTMTLGKNMSYLTMRTCVRRLQTPCINSRCVSFMVCNVLSKREAVVSFQVQVPKTAMAPPGYVLVQRPHVPAKLDMPRAAGESLSVASVAGIVKSKSCLRGLF